MKDSVCTKFQQEVSNVLVRHKSILDVVTKFQESSAKVNRAIVKSVTSCGCIQIDAKKQDVPDDISYEELTQYTANHISGELCDICKDKVEKELANHLFYLAAICNALDLDMASIMKTQSKHLETLGKYSLY
ncbi:MAG: hypothetical protein K0R93_3753 [Anaerosolibacter sp.]|jgi:predicted house-cleaning noncanonical NTP pyrophosphatase (MazG superfamily)|uniref:DUF1573 domain-containing protein n=1 Tax=Anaerosolibacter sp. TaxID=1872527 RepID=UPI00262389B2|nr:DUF1573 domain-containing protein [Anaerosolibacter sp.]MDF2548855.1 hypothetical protein [Anaerosolibacter sp.]